MKQPLPWRVRKWVEGKTFPLRAARWPRVRSWEAVRYEGRSDVKEGPCPSTAHHTPQLGVPFSPGPIEGPGKVTRCFLPVLPGPLLTLLSHRRPPCSPSHTMSTAGRGPRSHRHFHKRAETPLAQIQILRKEDAWTLGRGWVSMCTIPALLGTHPPPETRWGGR